MSAELTTQLAQDWIQPISDANPVGNDARYEPAHGAAREEVAKLDTPGAGDVSWDEVVIHSESVLKNNAKDLLMGSYLAYALGEQKGLLGYVQGTAVLAELMDRYWDSMYPPAKRIRGRINAINWFVERTEIDLTDRPLTAADREPVTQLEATTKRLRQVISERFVDEAPAMRPLLDTVQRLVLSLPAPEPQKPPTPPELPKKPEQTTPTQDKPVATATPPAAAPPAAAPADAPPPPADMSQVLPYLHKVSKSLLETSKNLRDADSSSTEAMWLWMNALYLPILEAPATTNGTKTQVPAPAAIALQEIQSAIAKKNWASVLKQSTWLLDKSRLYLDCHATVSETLKHLGESHEAAYNAHRQGMAALLTRMPELPQLAFADGTPMASTSTKAWLEDVAGSIGGDDSPQSDKNGAGDDLPSTIDEARRLHIDKKGAERMGALHALAQRAPEGRVRFMIQLAAAEVAQDLGQLRVSEALYGELSKEITERGLHKWEPSLCATCLAGYHRCLAALAKKRETTMDSAQDVYRRLCQVDPAAALGSAT